MKKNKVTEGVVELWGDEINLNKVKDILWCELEGAEIRVDE